MSMRQLTLSVLIITILGISVWEALWRLEHIPLGDSISNKYYTMQIRSLPEASKLPYGQGVFIKLRYSPLWFSSKLVFSDYCESKPSIKWFTNNQLTIDCKKKKTASLNINYSIFYNSN